MTSPPPSAETDITETPPVLTEKASLRPLIAPEIDVWSLIVISLVILSLGVGLGLLVFLFDATAAPDMDMNGPMFTERGIIALLLAQNTAFALAVYLVLIRVQKLPWTALGLRPAEAKWLKLALAIAVLWLPVSIGIEALIEGQWDVSFNQLLMEIYAPYGFTWTSALGVGLVGGLVAPFCEEILFRGVIFAWMRRHWNLQLSMIASAAIFAAFHVIPAVMPEIFILGLVMAWLYERSGSIYPAILLHVTNNLIAFTWLFGSLAYATD